MNKLIIRMIPCECEWNCGTLIPEFDKWGRRKRFVKGHQRRGKQHSPETKQLISKSHIGLQSGEKNPFFGKQHSDATKQKISKNRIGKYSGENHPMYGKHHSPETKQLMSINHADYNGENNPNYGKTPSDETKQKISRNHVDVSGENNPMFGKKHSPETIKKIIKSREGYKHSPETRQKISKINTGKTRSHKTRQLMSINHADVNGQNNPNWQGGLSFEPYCQEWTSWLKEEIKERDNHQCQNPDCNSLDNLCVHHIDYDKKNCSTDNLITLCSSCNGRANGNRDYWKEFYTNITNKLEEIF